jgi:hypothetical protein
MIAFVNKPQFRGKYKRKSFCQWLRLTGKTYIIESNDDDDWDNGELINGNKPMLRTGRRPGVFQLFKV